MESKSMTDVSIRAKSAEDDEWVVSLRNRINDHVPPITVVSLRHFERVGSMAEKSHDERMVAEREGHRVGTIRLESMWWAERPGGYFVSVVVDPDLWNQGIGGRLFNWLLDRLHDLRAERAYSMVRSDRPASQEFASRRGGWKS
jgi:N-acetylglutamate synthase-like GNAT family acetyltransferase